MVLAKALTEFMPMPIKSTRLSEPIHGPSPVKARL